MADTSGVLDAGTADVGWLLDAAPSPTGSLVLAHGAGAAMDHVTMTAIAAAVAAAGLDVFRFNFPFMQAGRRRVDSKAIAVATIEAAVNKARSLHRIGPLLLGGHSFGGRMASHAVLESVSVDGLVFCSFPLHPAGKPGIERAAHLAAIEAPMLFLSGTRDALATPDLLRDVVSRLRGGATLYWLDTADHGYRVQKRLRERTDSVFHEMAERIAAFARDL